MKRTEFRIAQRVGDVSTRQAPNGEEFDIRFAASTEALASDDGVIPVEAWDVRRFMKNPVFIAMHDLGAFDGLPGTVVGQVVDIGVERDLDPEAAPFGRALVAYVRFSNTPFGRQMRTLYEDGDLRAVSVRWDFRTEEIRPPTDEEESLYGDALQWVAERVELMELSSVILGADPMALSLRNDVQSAYKRCRDMGHSLDTLEDLMDKVRAADDGDEGGGIVGRLSIDVDTSDLDSLRDSLEQIRDLTNEISSGTKRVVDEGALADAIGDMQDALSAMDQWMRQGGALREAFGDISTTLSSLITGDQLGETIDADDDDERSLRGAMDEINEKVREAATLQDILDAQQECQALFLEKLEDLTGEEPEAETEEELEAEEEVEEKGSGEIAEEIEATGGVDEDEEGGEEEEGDSGTGAEEAEDQNAPDEEGDESGDEEGESGDEGSGDKEEEVVESDDDGSDDDDEINLEFLAEEEVESAAA